MKRTAIVMITLLCLVMAIGLTACNGGGQLSVPENVVISGNTISWDPVNNADGYIVEVDGKVITEVVEDKTKDLVIKDTFYTYMTDKPGEYSVRVKAHGVGNYTDSAFSAQQTIIIQQSLPAPTLELKKEEGKLTYSWNAIEGAKEYLLKVGIGNINEVTPITIKDATSYVIDLTQTENEYYTKVGEYVASVQAVSGDKNFTNSRESGQVSYINTKKLTAPTKFTCDRTIFKWESTDKDIERYRVTAVREGDGVKYENTTSSKSLSYDYLDIKEPGVYKVSVMAYNDSKKSVYLDSDASNEVIITILDSVDPLHFTLSGSQLSWNSIKDAKSYTITATTRTGTSFTINVDGGANTSYNLAENKDFRTADRVAKMFTFDIVANGNVENEKELIFDSKSVSMAKGNYYQYLPDAKDYADTTQSKGIIPELVSPEGKDAYYRVTTYPELIWALMNANGTTIRLENNIKITNTEFVSPISSFNGVFDGNKHTISNILMTDKFNRSSVSLFGDLGKGAVIKDLVISDLSVQVSDKNLQNGIIANTNNGTIDNVVVMTSSNGDAKVRVLNDSDIALIAHTNNGIISNVIVKGDVQGKNTAGIAVNNNKDILNATVYGKLTGIGVSGETRVGGIAAYNKGNISYSIVRASSYVNTAGESALAVVGGVVGTNAGEIHHTYATQGIKSNSVNKAYAGGFVGVNTGNIYASYVESASSIVREDAITYIAGFAAKNSGTISNAYSSISINEGYYENKAAFVADNTNGTLTRVVFNAGKAGDKATLVLESMKGTVDELSRGYQSNNLTSSVKEVLGEEFVVYQGYKSTVPVLKNVIYVSSASVITGIEQNRDLLTYSDFNKYYVGGEAKTIPSKIGDKPNEIRANGYSGYQIIRYSENIGTEAEPNIIVYNRLIQVR